jgi:hypothetical protein
MLDDMPPPGPDETPPMSPPPPIRCMGKGLGGRDASVKSRDLSLLYLTDRLVSFE